MIDILLRQNHFIQISCLGNHILKWESTCKGIPHVYIYIAYILLQNPDYEEENRKIKQECN